MSFSRDLVRINGSCGNYLTLALRLRDSFNDRILKTQQANDFVFCLDGQEIQPIKKDNGYYVINNIQNKQFNLKIFSDSYFDKEVSIDIDKISNFDKYKEIFLIPHYKHEKPPNDFYIEGKADLGTLVFAVRFSNRTNVRYMSFVKKQMALKISNPADESLVGRVMAVVDCDNNKFQSFFIENKLNDDTYEIDSEIDKWYKTSMPIQKAFVTQTDCFGEYKLYIGDSKVVGEQYIMSFYKNKKKMYKIIDVDS